MLRDKPHDVIQAYCFMADGYNAAPNKLALYLHVRGLVNAGDLDPVYTAASFLFIINAGFNGLWRVNKSGACNTPHGDGLPLQVDSERLLACSRALQSAIVTCGDFEPVIDAATDGGFILADPPYDPVSATASFDTYSAGGFSWADRERLVAALSRAASRGVRFTLTDSDTSRTRALYAHWRIDRMMVGRSINSDPTKRGRVGELVVTNGWRR
jgi:DNA adenine methylase